jgi:hypothetical protein
MAAIGEGGAANDHADCGEKVAGDEEFLPEQKRNQKCL